jgi:hypothetical protein
MEPLLEPGHQEPAAVLVEFRRQEVPDAGVLYAPVPLGADTYHGSSRAWNLRTGLAGTYASSSAVCDSRATGKNRYGWR